LIVSRQDRGTELPATGLVSRLAATLPFYYGWVILGCVLFACFSRAGPAVATLSIFVTPMTEEFGWSRTAIAGAVSLGGVLAALSSPMIGTYLDRQGARLVLCLAVLATGITLMALSTIHSLVAFYALYCIARMNWAGPFDLGIYGALNNWFVARRALAASFVTLAQMVGLISMPLIGYWVSERHGWRTGWLVIGALVLLVGFLPSWFFMVRRPEDLGLLPDGATPPDKDTAGSGSARQRGAEEPAFTRAEALRTRAFWLLAFYTAMIYPVQAGMSLHQAAHLIERGLSTASAAAVVSTFSFASAVTGFGYGVLQRWLNVKAALALAGVLLASSGFAMMSVSTPLSGILAGALFGLGIGGVHTLLPVAWADYFGRRNFGAIRGIALTIQVASQAAGPLVSGILRDLTGDYTASLLLFATLSGLGAMAALAIAAPARARSGQVRP
jgi:OFA family oxalate/formate antiporter-like MFS transporter